jgi:signal transduction histidine kinase
VSTQVATAVAVPLAARDYTALTPADRAALLADLAPFLGSGMVHRVKVWAVVGAQVRIAFSDEARIESALRPFDPELARRLDAGEAVVLAVPDDAEHRFEAGRADELREVFIGFRDAGDNPARLEIYVPVDTAATVRHAMGVLLPLALLGVLLLGGAMLPLSIALARRIDRDRRARHDALHYGLAAAELARRELARELHDDVIPDLAAAGVLLDTAEHTPPARAAALVGDARGLIAADVRRLRALLTDLLPPPLTPAAVPAAFAQLVERLRGADAEVGLHVEDVPVGAAAAVLLHRVGGELLRNAAAHAGASRIEVRLGPDPARPGAAVRLQVADDGHGFDQGAPPRPGHIGLLLVRRTVEDAGGRVTVESGPGGTTVTVSVPADAPDLLLRGA